MNDKRSEIPDLLEALERSIAAARAARLRHPQPVGDADPDVTALAEALLDDDVDREHEAEALAWWRSQQ